MTESDLLFAVQACSCSDCGSCPLNGEPVCRNRLLDLVSTYIIRNRSKIAHLANDVNNLQADLNALARNLYDD